MGYSKTKCLPSAVPPSSSHQPMTLEPNSKWALRLGRSTQRPRPPFSHCLLQLLLLTATCQMGLAAAAVIGTKRLYCMSCVRVESDTTVLDQFRVRQGLPLPVCKMEPIECEPHQDTCVTITMQISHRQFWVGSGCDQRVNYDFPSGGRDGCVELPAIYRNFHPGFMEERRTLQRLCLCSGNLCNSATASSSFTFIHKCPTILVAIMASLLLLWRWI